MLPLLPKTLEVRPEPAEWKKIQPSWTDMLDEDADYQIMLAESLYGDVYKHCCKAFPTALISCYGHGRVCAIELLVKPIAAVDPIDQLRCQSCELHEARLRAGALQRKVDMLEPNLAVMVKERTLEQLEQVEERAKEARKLQDAVRDLVRRARRGWIRGIKKNSKNPGLQILADLPGTVAILAQGTRYRILLLS